MILNTVVQLPIAYLAVQIILGSMKKLMFGKLFINFMFVFALVMAAFPISVSAFSGSGIGTNGDPFLITNCTQLQEMNDDLSASYKLANDIDCSATTSWNAGAGFVPIMDNGCFVPFTGTLDGNNHTISNLYENFNDQCAGLFGYLSGASVSDLTLKDVDITTSEDYAGGLAGYADSGTTIANVHTTGTIDGQYYIGGLIGQLTGDSITRSSSTVNITGESDLGGLVGSAEGDISQSYATGNMSGYESIGGFVGGFNSGTISDSYATGNATGLANGDGIGGFTGYNGGTITNSYSTGTATGETTGGFVVTNGGTVTNSFWDTQTSGHATSDGGTGKSTAQMKNIATFTGATWDFTTIWDISSTKNNGYPFFRWQTFPVVADGDGVSDVVEDAAPNNGDGNNDGTADSQQANVVSYVNSVTNKYVVLEVSSACTITSASNTAESTSVKDSGFDYPVGLMNFTINCGTPGFTASVAQYYYGAPSGNLVLRKYNPSTNAYFTINGATLAPVTISAQAVMKATYQVVDGGVLDIDGTANGTIVDPAGLALSAIGVPNTGLGGNWK